MLKIVALLSVTTLVVAPPPGGYSKYRAPNQADSSSSGSPNSQFANPVIIPATPLTENPNPLSANINMGLNSDYSASQYSPSEGDRSKDFDVGLGLTQFPSIKENSGLVVSPIGTPRSARRTEPRYLTRQQKKSGMSPAPKKTRPIQWLDYEDQVVDAPDEGRATVPVTIEMSGMPSSRFPGPKLSKDQRMMMPMWGSTSRPFPTSVDGGDDDDDGNIDDDTDSLSDDDDDYLGLDELPATNDLRTFQPGLTPRLKNYIATRPGY